MPAARAQIRIAARGIIVRRISPTTHRILETKLQPQFSEFFSRDVPVQGVRISALVENEIRAQRRCGETALSARQ
jgi:hypothetical protein